MNANLSQTNHKWLRVAEDSLKEAGAQTARLDCLVLLEDETGKDRGWLLAHPEYILGSAQIERLNTKITQRISGMPLSYIRGTKEFFNRDFLVTEAVLEPRPESESIIEILLGLPFPKSQEILIADIGTGSGALGITAQLELQNSQVDLLEISAEAIKIAKMNVVNHALSISVIESDLLANAPRSYDVLLCNLPYVPDNYPINTAAMFEPKIALFGGTDGLDLYRRLFAQLRKNGKMPLFILCESFPTQHKQLTEIAQRSGYEQYQTADFIQCFKHVN